MCNRDTAYRAMFAMMQALLRARTETTLSFRRARKSRSFPKAEETAKPFLAGPSGKRPKHGQMAG